MSYDARLDFVPHGKAFDGSVMEDVDRADETSRNVPVACTVDMGLSLTAYNGPQPVETLLPLKPKVLLMNALDFEE